MLLFICHASEDQPDFVRPLAEALSIEFKVWYSEYELKLGDSLLQRIDGGLATCDFAIVVLSHAFFAKQWPQAELDGLIARESKSRKVILPIWKDITKEEVAAYSPILAGRLAATNTAGLPKIVEEIRIAVGVSERQRNLTRMEFATERVRELRQNVAEKKRAEQLLYSEEGVQRLTTSVDTIFKAVETALTTDQTQSDPIKFGISKPLRDSFQVMTIKGMYLHLRAKNLHCAADTRLEFKVVQRSWDDLGRPTSGVFSHHDDEFRPTFRSADRLVWVSTEDSTAYDTDALVAHVTDIFVQKIQTVLVDD